MQDKNLSPTKRRQKYVSKNIPKKEEWEKFVTGRTKIYGKLIKGIPRRPNEVYRDEWEGWPEFLGGLGKTKYFLDYKSAKRFLKNMIFKIFMIIEKVLNREY